MDWNAYLRRQLYDVCTDFDWIDGVFVLTAGVMATIVFELPLVGTALYGYALIVATRLIAIALLDPLLWYLDRNTEDSD